jgi:hypothetical protein
MAKICAWILILLFKQLRAQVLKHVMQHPVDFIVILGAIYTCDSAFESPYDSVYDFPHKVVCN